MPSADDEFTVVFRACYADVLRFVRRRIAADDADEVAAEVFTIAWRRWSDAPADVRPWLFGIAHKVLCGAHRTWRRRRSLALRVASQPAASLLGGGGHVDEAMDLAAAWSRLSDQDRESIALVAWDGLTGEQAAVVLGCSRSAFAVRLSRARRRFEAELDRADTPSDVRPTDTTTATRSSTLRPSLIQKLPTMQGEVR